MVLIVLFHFGVVNFIIAHAQATQHAEFIALHSLVSTNFLSSLGPQAPGLFLYVTCEPCIMYELIFLHSFYLLPTNLYFVLFALLSIALFCLPYS
jgi:hypothetical protein